MSMANERLEGSAHRTSLAELRGAAIADVMEASREGDPETVIAASLRLATLINAISTITGLYPQIGGNSYELAAPVSASSADALASFIPPSRADESAPAVFTPTSLPDQGDGDVPVVIARDEHVVLEESVFDSDVDGEQADDSEEALPISTPVVLPAMVVASSPISSDTRPASQIPVLRPIPRPAPDLRDSRPQRRVSAELLDGLPLEDRVLRAVFGLNFQRTQLYYDTFARSVDAVFGDSLPSRVLNPDKSREEFGKALRQQAQIVDGFFASLRAIDTNPSLATEEQILKAKKLRNYLLEEGYPDGLSADDLSVISHRRWGFNLQTFLANLANRANTKASTNPIDSGVALVSVVKDKRVHSGNRGGLVDPDLRDGVSLRTSYRSVKGPALHTPQPNSEHDGAYVVIKKATVRSSEQISQIDRMLGDAIFAIDTEKVPVNNSLATVAEKVYPKELEGLEGSERESKIKYLIETKITPYISDRMRALAATSNPSANVTLRQVNFAREIEYWTAKYGYPKGLSVAEMGRLMSKQITLPELLALKNGASAVAAGRNNTLDAQMPSAPPAPEDSGRAENGANHLKRKDRLTDAQRNYLDVVFATDSEGQTQYPTRAEAIKARFPEEYQRALENPDKTHNMALLLAHFGRTGKKVRQMLEEFFATGVGPAELRAHVHKLKNNPSLAGLPNEVLVELSQR